MMTWSHGWRGDVEFGGRKNNLVFFNFLTKGWAGQLSIKRSLCFLAAFFGHFFEPIFQRTRLSSMPFSLPYTRPLKHRGLLNFPRTNGYIFSLPSMLQHIITVTLSLLFFPRRNTFHPWMLEFCSAEACKTGSFHRRSKYFSARNQWLNWVIFRSIFEHNLIPHSHFCKLYSGAVWISR